MTPEEALDAILDLWDTNVLDVHYSADPHAVAALFEAARDASREAKAIRG